MADLSTYSMCNIMDGGDTDIKNFCKNVINEMLGYSSLDNPSTTYTNSANTNPQTTNINHFYKNWLTREKTDIFTDFMGSYNVAVINVEGDSPATNLYQLGINILNIYFNTIYNGVRPTLENTKPNQLLEALYGFGRDDSNLGIFSQYLNNQLCVNVQSSQLSNNENYKKWCGCYLPEYKKTVSDINTQKLNYIKEQKINPPSSADNWLFGNQCMPYCTNPESIKIYYKNKNLQTVVGTTDSVVENNQTFDPVQCVATVCLINNYSADITQSDGAHVSINQLCKCSLLDNCICIIDKNIDENSLGKIKPGLDQHIALKQSCGQGSLCADIDKSGNITSLTVCPQDNNGYPDPTLPESILPENGKFTPRNLSSIQNVNFYDIWFFILFLFLIIFYLYFLSAKKIKKEFDAYDSD